LSFQTGVTNLYNEFVNKGVTPSGQTLAAMKAAVVSLYNAGTTAGKGSHSTTYTMTSSEKTKDLGASHSYRYINANNVYNAGSNSSHHSTTYTLTTAEKTKDLGGAHNYRYINANNVYNTGSNSAHQTGTYTLGTKASAAASTYDMGNTNKYRYINATAAWNKASSTGYVSGTAVGYNSGTTAGRPTGFQIFQFDTVRYKDGYVSQTVKMAHIPKNIRVTFTMFCNRNSYYYKKNAAGTETRLLTAGEYGSSTYNITTTITFNESSDTDIWFTTTAYGFGHFNNVTF